MQYRKIILWTNQDGISRVLGDSDRDSTNKLKVEAIVNMTPPKNTKQVRAFVGVINYYKDMWDRRSHILHPLTALTSNQVNIKCTDV